MKYISLFRKRWITAWAIAMTLTATVATRAQEGAMGIAAVVNEDIITVFDVQSRLGMVLTTSGMDNTAETQRRILPQVIQSLIEERLKMQEARRLKIKMDSSEVLEAVSTIENNNNMAPGTFRQLFSERGIDMGTLYSQLEADVAWVKVVRQELARDIVIPPEEVKNVLDRLKASQGKPEHLLGEVFLPLSSGASEADVQTLAERLVQQARGGTPFPAIAQQFSQSPTAAVGGDLGWVLQGDLEDELDRAVAKMEVNEISDPIRTGAGYHILMLRGRRAAGAPDPLMAVVELSQIVLPTEGGRAKSQAEINQLTEEISTRAGTCDQMNAIGKRAGGPGTGKIEPMRTGGLPDAVRDQVVKLPVGRVSPPIDIKAARIFVMVCARQEDSGIPSEDQITQKLENDKLENVARQKLRDLRRQAIIDIRI